MKEERLSRELWVGSADITPYPVVRSTKLERRAAACGAEAAASSAPLMLDYNRATYEEAERLHEKKATAIAAKLEAPPRKDVYVKGAQEWEKNCWKVRAPRALPPPRARRAPRALARPAAPRCGTRRRCRRRSGATSTARRSRTTWRATSW